MEKCPSMAAPLSTCLWKGKGRFYGITSILATKKMIYSTLKCHSDEFTRDSLYLFSVLNDSIDNTLIMKWFKHHSSSILLLQVDFMNKCLVLLHAWLLKPLKNMQIERQRCCSGLCSCTALTVLMAIKLFSIQLGINHLNFDMVDRDQVYLNNSLFNTDTPDANSRKKYLHEDHLLIYITSSIHLLYKNYLKNCKNPSSFWYQMTVQVWVSHEPEWIEWLRN